MNGEDVPRYVACDYDLTLEHILIECGGFAVVRQRYYEAEDISQLFRKSVLQKNMTSCDR